MDEAKKKKSKETYEQKTEREKNALVERLKNNKLIDINSRVAFILNHFPNARNNDVDLTIQYWKVFHNDIVGDSDQITYKQLYKLTRANSLIRARAKVQNTYGLFLASRKVRQRRSELSEEHRQRQAEDNSACSVTSVFCDESGKNDNYLVIGSVWINDPYRLFKLYQNLVDWKNEQGINYEFHFSSLKRQRISIAIQFIQEALSESDVLGFKAVIIQRDRTKDSNIDESIYKLHYQLVIPIPLNNDPNFISLFSNAFMGTAR